MLKRRNKYNAKTCILDGHAFQSRLELDYYLYLKLIHVNNLKVHPTVNLIAGIKYVADFYFEEGENKIFVDTKSPLTKGGRFPTIKKLWAELGPGTLRVVYRGPRGTFIVKKEIKSKLKDET